MTGKILAVGSVVALNFALVAPPASADGACAAPLLPMTFSTPRYVDEHRAGGEPMLQTHPDGTILYAAHAGTTHFYTAAAADDTTTAFVENYTGQTYMWWSDDAGDTWTYVPREVPDNLPLQGFSDPDFAIDAAGQVYLSEINLVNVAMSKSTDVGRSFTLQNFFAQTITDRQWSEADRKDEIYLVGNAFAGGTAPGDPAGNFGHVLYKSTDGGVTFSPGVNDPGGLGDLRVDKRDGTLYEMNYAADGTLSLAAFRSARSGDLGNRELNVVARGVNLLSHWPAFDVDAQGNLYVVWDDAGLQTPGEIGALLGGEPAGGYPAGIYYSYSTDQGRHWAKPLRIDPDDKTDIWPWLAVGDTGRVAVAWFQADVHLDGSDAQTQGDHGWNVMAGQSVNGLGCDGSAVPGFRIVRATAEPFHTGTICMQGTICQAQLIDRRLGDYFAIDIDAQGMMMAAYSDTRRDGAVSLPAFLRQEGGTPFVAAAAPPSPAPKPSQKPVVLPKKERRTLPSTGIPGSGVGIGFGLALVAAALRRRAATR